MTIQKIDSTGCTGSIEVRKQESNQWITDLKKFSEHLVIDIGEGVKKLENKAPGTFNIFLKDCSLETLEKQEFHQITHITILYVTSNGGYNFRDIHYNKNGFGNNGCPGLLLTIEGWLKELQLVN